MCSVPQVVPEKQPRLKKPSLTRSSIAHPRPMFNTSACTCSYHWARHMKFEPVVAETEHYPSLGRKADTGRGLCFEFLLLKGFLTRRIQPTSYSGSSSVRFSINSLALPYMGLYVHTAQSVVHEGQHMLRVLITGSAPSIELQHNTWPWALITHLLTSVGRDFLTLRQFTPGVFGTPRSSLP